MIVYRCEDRTRCGPFKTSPPFYNERYELLDRHNSNLTHPVPWKDDILLFNDEDFCGFAKISHLKKWFTKEEREKLREWGWNFYSLEIEKSLVKFGKHQCAFPRYSAKIIKELHENELSNRKQNRTNKKRVEARSKNVAG